MGLTPKFHYAEEYSVYLAWSDAQPRWAKASLTDLGIDTTKKRKACIKK